MPDVAAVLRQEITRLARKEDRTQIAPLRNAQTELRKRLAALQSEVAELARTVKRLEKQAASGRDAGAAPAQTTPQRYSPGWVAADRKRLGLSAEDYGRLVGVTGQTIYSWETGASRPRAEKLAAWAAVRGIGKREARRRLEQLDSPE
ncbi:MAG: helix-turn-helix domain-containing protein [Thermoanaerobaculales bacterium]|jgi:DNA-binding transcriptional regulator YiaG|nr:helix-turn-helix domain-containing protein [Thermoanaerobaculales bacterium]